jgi:CBS domain containing-hemolysin-like protein
VITQDGLRLEVLQASERRVERVRVSLSHPEEVKSA